MLTKTAQRQFIRRLIILTIANLAVVSISLLLSVNLFFNVEKTILLFSSSVSFCLFETVFSVLATFLTIKDYKSKQELDDYLEKNSKLANEVGELTKSRIALKKEKDAALEANLYKNRYLSGISHELRTPLNSVLGYAQILSSAEDIPERYKKAVSIISRAGSHLANLIEELLDISKIEAKKLEIRSDRVNLGKMLDTLVTYYSDVAASKGICFEYAESPFMPQYVRCDEKRLNQIFTNLLSNAVKYTQKGKVLFSVSFRSSVAEFTVKDTGIGIKKEDLKKIFDPFARLDDAKRIASGSGLGLTITNLLVTVMGGDLEVDSVYQEGTTFKLKLALPAMNAPSEITREKKVIGYKCADNKQYHVITVDDNEQHRDLIKDILEPVGFKVSGAKEPDEALALLGKDNFDLYLVDVSMPGHDGWYLLKKLRESGYRGPVVMVSAEASEGSVPLEYKSLHNGYIIKPFKQSALFDRIASLLPIDYIYKSEDKDLNPVEDAHNFFYAASEPNSQNQLSLCHKTEQSQAKIVLERTIFDQFMAYIEIGYIKGIKKLDNKLLESGVINLNQKEQIEELLGKFNFDGLRTLLDVEK